VKGREEKRRRKKKRKERKGKERKGKERKGKESKGKERKKKKDYLSNPFRVLNGSISFSIRSSHQYHFDTKQRESGRNASKLLHEHLRFCGKKVNPPSSKSS